MKITYNWLKEYVDFAWDHAELVDRLTMSGLEKESVEDLGERYRGVVVGEVLECLRHPNADRLKVCKVSIGSTTHTIVCGASNAAAGKKVPVILPGHSLPDGTRIGKSSIRGVESAGMICSEVELDLGVVGLHVRGLFELGGGLVGKPQLGRLYSSPEIIGGGFAVHKIEFLRRPAPGRCWP